MFESPPGFLGHIYHNDAPKFFAWVTEIDLYDGFKSMEYGFPSKFFLYIPGTGQVRLFLLLIDKQISKPNLNLESTVLQAVSWYSSVLNISDMKKSGKSSTYKLLKDFSPLIPGLQIIQLPKFGKYVLSSFNWLKSFDDPMEMDKFLSEVLGYTDQQLETGHTNILNIKYENVQK